MFLLRLNQYYNQIRFIFQKKKKIVYLLNVRICCFQKTETDQTHFYDANKVNTESSLQQSDSEKHHVIPTQTQQIVCLEKVCHHLLIFSAFLCYLYLYITILIQVTETDSQELEDDVDELSNVKLELKKTKVRYTFCYYFT